MTSTAIRATATAMGAVLLLAGTAAGAAHAESGDGWGSKPTRMTLCSSVSHDIKVASTRKDWIHGNTTTLTPGQCVTTTGNGNQEGFVKHSGRNKHTRYPWSQHLDTGVYLGNGFWVNAHNPYWSYAYASLSRYGDGTMPPGPDTDADRYSEYEGWNNDTLEIDGIRVNAQWMGERDGYKDWVIRVI